MRKLNRKIIIGHYYRGDSGTNLVNYTIDEIIKNYGYEFVEIKNQNRIKKVLEVIFQLIKHKNSHILMIYPTIIINSDKKIYLKIAKIIYKIMHKIIKINKNSLRTFIVDLFLEQHNIEGYKKELALKARTSFFDMCDEIYVPHNNYNKYIGEKHFNKIKYFGIYDEYHEDRVRERIVNEHKCINLCLIGNLAKERTESIIYDLPVGDNIKYFLYGVNGDWINDIDRSDLKYCGLLEYDELKSTISTYTAGLVLYSKQQEKYFEFAVSARLTTYLYSKLPIITLKKYKTMSEIIQNNNFGIVIDKLEQIVNINYGELEQIHIGYDAVRKNVKYDELFEISNN